MGNTDIQKDLHNIKIELDKIGAAYEIDIYGNIRATLPKTATIASVPFKDKDKKTGASPGSERKILFPKWRFDTVSGTK